MLACLFHSTDKEFCNWQLLSLRNLGGSPCPFTFPSVRYPKHKDFQLPSFLSVQVTRLREADCNWLLAFKDLMLLSFKWPAVWKPWFWYHWLPTSSWVVGFVAMWASWKNYLSAQISCWKKSYNFFTFLFMRSKVEVDRNTYRKQ